MGENRSVLLLGDCLDVMLAIPDKTIDMILCDLPYGTTKCKWDTIIPFEPLWVQYKRIIKNKGTIILTASQPFTSALIVSNLKMFKYEWIWEKPAATGFLNSKIRPMVAHENICVFYSKQVTYNPQKTDGHKAVNSFTKTLEAQNQTEIYGKATKIIVGNRNTDRYPRSVQIFSSDKQKSCLHPTQKPVALFEYLIKTYTNENDVVLDNCMGSGTTGVACKNLNRQFIGIEKEERYFKIAKERINKAKITLDIQPHIC